MSFAFPRVYPILDASVIPSAEREVFLRRLAESLGAAGITLLEYRNKNGSDGQLKDDARILRAALPATEVKLILDDRAHLIDSLQFDGVHVDNGDVSPGEARRLLGPERIVGTFGGSDDLLAGVLAEPADYLSIGPVFPTTTKETNKRPIGVEGVRRLRGQAGADVVLVAAAGITLETAKAVLEAGANTVAVAAAIFRAPDPAKEYRRWIEALG